MASATPFSQSFSTFMNSQLSKSLSPFSSTLLPPNPLFLRAKIMNLRLKPMNRTCPVTVVSAAETQKKRYPGEAKGFVEEMRLVAMRLHSKEQSKEGEKEAKWPEERPVAMWEPTIEGYLRFLVDCKLVYDTLEGIIDKATFPSYAEFKNTGLERSEKLTKDLEWLKGQGYEIPEPSAPGRSYTEYLKDLGENNPNEFICHIYNIYLAHSAGGRKIGRKVAEMFLNNKELEFYVWEDDISVILQNVGAKLDKMAEGWTREEKTLCLEETAKSFRHSGEMVRLILL